jgi:hypothetical protein
MAEQPERREESRFRLDLITHVTAKGADGETFREKAILLNMSAGGASFVTRQPDRYFQGQKLDIELELPGTAELKAVLQGTATVSRIDDLPEADTRRTDRRYAVAVVIAEPLQFIRKDAEMGVKKPAAKLE